MFFFSFIPLLTNHGWAGPEFIKALLKYERSEIDKKLDYWVTKFKTDFGDDTAYRFYENLVAVSMVSGEIAHQADIVSIDIDRVFTKLVQVELLLRCNSILTLKNHEQTYLLIWQK